MSAAPTFVFTYLPSAAKTTATPNTTGTTVPSLYDQTTAFLTSARKAFANPKLTAQQDRIATLQHVKAGLEADMAMKKRAGMGVSEGESERVRMVERALVGVVAEEK